MLAGWKPELWAAEDLLNRTDAFVASGDALDEVFRARLVAAVGAARAALLLPGERPLDVPAGLDVAGDAGSRRRGDPPRRHAAVLPGAGGAGHRRHGPAPASARDDAVASRQDREPRSARSIIRRCRYLVHLNAPGWNVIGATAPWLPGVAEGHNDRVAWTRRADRRRHAGRLCREAEPGEPASGRGRRPLGRHRRAQRPIAVRGRKTPVDFDHRDDASRRHRRVRSRAPSGVRGPLVRQRAGRGRGARGAGARSRGFVRRSSAPR